MQGLSTIDKEDQQPKLKIEYLRKHWIREKPNELSLEVVEILITIEVRQSGMTIGGRQEVAWSDQKRKSIERSLMVI